MRMPSPAPGILCVSLFLAGASILAAPVGAQEWPPYPQVEEDIRLTESTVAVLDRRLGEMRHAVADRDVWVVWNEKWLDYLTAEDMVTRCWMFAVMLKKEGEIEPGELEAVVRAALIEAWKDSEKNKRELRDRTIPEVERTLARLRAELPRMHEQRRLQERSFRERCGLVVGTWKWFNGGVVTLVAGGGASGVKPPDAPGSGTWTCHQGETTRVVIRWSTGGWVDQLTLDASGNRLAGTNQYGNPVWGERQR